MEGLRQKTGMINKDMTTFAGRSEGSRKESLSFMFGTEHIMTKGDPKKLRSNCFLGSQLFYSKRLYYSGIVCIMNKWVLKGKT